MHGQTYPLATSVWRMVQSPYCRDGLCLLLQLN